MTVYFFSLLNFYLAIIILIFNVKVNKNALYLSGYLLCLGLFGLIHNFMFDEESPIPLALLRGHVTPLNYALGPLLYFYVRGTINDSFGLKKLDYLHFLPVLISFFSLIPFIFSPFSYKLEMAKLIINDHKSSVLDQLYWLIPHYFHFYLRTFSYMIYSVASLILVISSRKKFEQISAPKPQKKLIIRWLFTLTALSCLIFIFYVPLTFYLINFVRLPFTISEVAYNIFDRTSGYAYCVIPLTVLVLPQILYGLPVASTLAKPKPSNFWEDTASILEEDPFLDVSKKILAHLKEDKPYLNPDFNLDMIAEKLLIPKHHLYYCFGNIIKIKFSKVRNRLRVEHAKELLQTGKSQMLKLEAIGFESGFSSRSHFFATFKEETGMTPSEYLEQNNNWN